MNKLVALLYGIVAYFAFFGTILYAIGFVTGVGVPKTIDDGPDTPVLAAIFIDIVLMSIFAVQHSVMARPAFKRWWTKFIAPPIERSTFVLLASLALMLLFWQWRPIPAAVWQVTNLQIATGLIGLSFAGWALVFASTFMIDHFELFGLTQVFKSLFGTPMAPPQFKTPLLYNFVRHPIYLGFLVAFWATPTMTVGHLLLRR